MKRAILLFCLGLLSSFPQGPQCSGSGIVWSCQAGVTAAQITTVITAAANNAVTTFAAGAYPLSTFIKFSNAKGMSFICGSPPNFQGASTTAPCLIQAPNGGQPIFGTDTFTGVVPNLYRISGFTFNGNGTSGGGFGTIYWDSYNGGTGGATVLQVRVDHDTFLNYTNGSQTTLIGSGGQHMELYGVYDHNWYNNSTQIAMAIWIGGINPNPPPAQQGTGNNLFLEDNLLTFASVGNASAEGCTDGWGGAAFVVRHNTSLNCLWTIHGNTHSGGPANYEFYKNTIKVDAGAVSAGVQSCYHCFHSQGAGLFIAFDNIFTSYSGKSGNALAVAHYRDYAWSGTPGTGTYSLDGGQKPCDGSSFASDGNRAPITTWYGYPCWNAPGRDFATQSLFPMFNWNNRWSDTGAEVGLILENQGLTGDAVPPSCTSQPAGTCNYHAIHQQQDREAETAVSALAQTSPTMPFNGTTGMGFGTLANRPTTCTTFSEPGSGVGYFATDQGTQGTLYRCSAKNTWTVQYQPYTYPHPLVGSGGFIPSPPSNLSGQAGVY